MNRITSAARSHKLASCSTSQSRWTLGAAFLLLALAAPGCSGVRWFAGLQTLHNPTDRVRYPTSEFHGHYPTCWRPWSPGWKCCPVYVPPNTTEFPADPGVEVVPLPPPLPMVPVHGGLPLEEMPRSEPIQTPVPAMPKLSIPDPTESIEQPSIEKPMSSANRMPLPDMRSGEESAAVPVLHRNPTTVGLESQNDPSTHVESTPGQSLPSKPVELEMNARGQPAQSPTPSSVHGATQVETGMLLQPSERNHFRSSDPNLPVPPMPRYSQESRVAKDKSIGRSVPQVLDLTKIPNASAPPAPKQLERLPPVPRGAVNPAAWAEGSDTGRRF